MRVIFALNQEQSKRAKEIVSKVKEIMKSSTKDISFVYAGNLIGLVPVHEDYMNMYYEKGQVTMTVSRRVLLGEKPSVFLDALAHIFDSIPLSEYTVEKYMYDDRVPVWYLTMEQYKLQQVKEGKLKVDAAYFLKQLKQLEEGQQLESWQETLLKQFLANLKPLPKVGTPEYRQAAAGGTYDELKRKHEVQTAYTFYLMNLGFLVSA